MSQGLTGLSNSLFQLSSVLSEKEQQKKINERQQFQDSLKTMPIITNYLNKKFQESLSRNNGDENKANEEIYGIIEENPFFKERFDNLKMNYKDYRLFNGGGNMTGVKYSNPITNSNLEQLRNQVNSTTGSNYSEDEFKSFMDKGYTVNTQIVGDNKISSLQRPSARAISESDLPGRPVMEATVDEIQKDLERQGTYMSREEILSRKGEKYSTRSGFYGSPISESIERAKGKGEVKLTQKQEQDLNKFEQNARTDFFKTEPGVNDAIELNMDTQGVRNLLNSEINSVNELLKSMLLRQFGEKGVFTNQDVQRAGGDPSVINRLNRKARQLSIGDSFTKKDRREFLEALDLVIESRQAAIDRLMDEYAVSKSKGFDGKVSPERVKELINLSFDNNQESSEDSVGSGESRLRINMYSPDKTEVQLSDGSIVSVEQAKSMYPYLFEGQ